MGNILEITKVFPGDSVKMEVVEGGRPIGDTCFMGGGADASGLRKMFDPEI